MTIQWFPGHMAKARRLIEKELKLVDVVIEILDARVPESSRNPMLDEIIGQRKPRLLILNKADLADPIRTQQWINKYNDENTLAIALNSTNQKLKAKNMVIDALMTLTKEKQERFKSKGAQRVSIRAMVVGIPNVGKSTFINRMIGKNAAITGNKPGVTKGKQWMKLSEEIELLDTPGLLWHKFDDQEVGYKLAMVGAISDDVFVWEEVAYRLIAFLQNQYPHLLQERFDLTGVIQELDTYELMQMIGRKRGAIVKGNKVDDLKTAHIFLKEFRENKIGRITLE